MMCDTKKHLFVKSSPKKDGLFDHGGLSRMVFLTNGGLFSRNLRGQSPANKQQHKTSGRSARNVQRPRRANIDGGVRECHTGEAAGLLQSFS
jgi:hypothetical protein